MQSLIKILLKIPGLQPSQISSGLKVPPLNVFYADKELDAEKLKNLLEKFGAVCAIEDTKKIVRKNESEKKVTGTMEAYLKRRHHHSQKFRRNFWISILAIFVMFALITSIDFSGKNKSNHPSSNQPRQAVQSTRTPSDYVPPSNEKNQKKNYATATTADIAKINNELKKNPYNTDAWKNLADNLEKQGDSAAARKAKESFEKSVKAQQVLASLAKAFGNNVRVEITEDAVYYRTSYDFTEREFYAESAKLLNSLNEKFPGKDLIVENYTPANKVQHVELRSPMRAK